MGGIKPHPQGIPPGTPPAPPGAALLPPRGARHGDGGAGGEQDYAAPGGHTYLDNVTYVTLGREDGPETNLSRQTPGNH